jgi:hypothetical protein
MATQWILLLLFGCALATPFSRSSPEEGKLWPNLGVRYYVILLFDSVRDKSFRKKQFLFSLRLPKLQTFLINKLITNSRSIYVTLRVHYEISLELLRYDTVGSWRWREHMCRAYNLVPRARVTSGLRIVLRRRPYVTRALGTRLPRLGLTLKKEDIAGAMAPSSKKIRWFNSAFLCMCII